MKTRSKIQKTFWLFALISIFTFNRAFSQSSYNSEYEELQGGLVGGINFSQVDGDGYKGYQHFGWAGGGILYLPLGNDVGLPFDATVAFSVEVLYEHKGAFGKGAVLNANLAQQRIDLHYAEVPIQINIFRGTRKSNFGMGLALGYLGFAEETIQFNDQQPQIKNGYPFHKLDLNYVLTANIHIAQGFFLSPRFEYSLVSIRNNNGRFGGRNEQFNNTLSLRLMYLIGKKS